MDWNELVDTIRPFVLRYTKAYPDLAAFWFSGELKLRDIDDIMTDFWEWVRHGEDGKLFVGQGQRDVALAFEAVLQEQLDNKDKNP